MAVSTSGNSVAFAIGVASAIIVIRSMLATFQFSVKWDSMDIIANGHCCFVNLSYFARLNQC
jgi:hypothetical protein